MAIILQSYDITQALCPHEEFDIDTVPSEEKPVQENMRRLAETEQRCGIPLKWLSKSVHKPLHLTHKPLSKALISHIVERTHS